MDRDLGVRRVRQRRGAGRPRLVHAVRLEPGGAPGHRRPVRRDQGAAGRLLPDRLRDPRARRGDRRALRPARRRRRAAAGDVAGRRRPVTARRRSRTCGARCAPHVLAALVRRYGDFDACRGRGAGGAARGGPAVARRGGAGQPARLADHGRRRGGWSTAGAPSGPVPTGSWSPQRRRAGRRHARPARPATATTRSTLLLLCCHPALTRPSQVALTLRAVAG